MTAQDDCPLCHPKGEQVLWADAHCRVIAVADADYPGFCRVVWQDHVREMTDLAPAERERLMTIVWAVETTLRATLAPIKVNLASLGNVVPHLHWHVIPRFAEDPHFPDPIWVAKKREKGPGGVDLALLRQSLLANLQGSRT